MRKRPASLFGAAPTLTMDPSYFAWLQAIARPRGGGYHFGRTAFPPPDGAFAGLTVGSVFLSEAH